MKKSIFTVLFITLFILSCKNDVKASKEEVTKSKVESNSAQESLIAKLTLDDSFENNDVRRYGVFPDKGIGTHPTSGNKKMDELLNLAELGVKLNFPEGLYKTVLDLSNRKNIELNFDKAAFSGAIIIRGKADNNVKNITLTGDLISYSSLMTGYVDKVNIDRVFIKNNKDLNISGDYSSGCNIYTGTMSLYINYLEIEGTGSDGDQFRFTPAALMVHGKSPAPNDILIKHAEIISSDRHGAYLSGKFISIEKLNIQAFAQGKIENMISIAYTAAGDEKKITGVWLNDFDDSRIGNLQINSTNSPKATDAIYLDSGDLTLPSIIDKVDVKGKKNKVRKTEPTNVGILE